MPPIIEITNLSKQYHIGSGSLIRSGCFMNEKELRKLLLRGETDVLEFKENLNESFYKNISAFANTKGGMIILGADNKGNIKVSLPSAKHS